MAVHSTSHLRLTWNASTDNVGVSGYDVWLNDTKVNTISTRVADFTGLQCGTSYTLRVNARDAAGNVSNRASVGGTTAACPPPPPRATMAQGPTGPVGYRYSITLDYFPANSGITIVCRDSVDPGGFFTFTLTTNGSGHAHTSSQCYSNDTGDHWFTANGISSNRVYWSRR